MSCLWMDRWTDWRNLKIKLEFCSNSQYYTEKAGVHFICRYSVFLHFCNESVQRQLYTVHCNESVHCTLYKCTPTRLGWLNGDARAKRGERVTALLRGQVLMCSNNGPCQSAWRSAFFKEPTIRSKHWSNRPIWTIMTQMPYQYLHQLFLICKGNIGGVEFTK